MATVARIAGVKTPDAQRAAFSWEVAAREKTQDAITHVKGMVRWFLANHENPATLVFDDKDGPKGKLGFRYGGPYDARAELIKNFRDELVARFDLRDDRRALVATAVAEIEKYGCCEWTGIRRLHDVPLLRAHEHYWSQGRVGRVHRFDEAQAKTLCGKELTLCPGDRDLGDKSDIDCGACLSALHRRPIA